MNPILRRLLPLVLVLAFLFVVGGWTRNELGIDFDVDSVRAFAEGLGPAGPFVFIFVVGGRSLLWLPSQVVLVVAGLCFGTLVGSIVGGAGLLISGLFLFLVARYAGQDLIEEKLGPRVRGLFAFTKRRTGAATFALACGYPLTPLSPLHAAAGWTPMPLANFIGAAFAGGVLRSALFAYFGDALIEASPRSLALPLLLFALAAGLPFAFPNGRAWLRELFAPTEPASAPEATEASDDPAA